MIHTRQTPEGDRYQRLAFHPLWIGIREALSAYTRVYEVRYV